MKLSDNKDHWVVEEIVKIIKTNKDNKKKSKIKILI